MSNNKSLHFIGLVKSINEEFELVKEFGKAKAPMYGVIGHYMDILYKYGKECNSIADLVS